MMPKSMWPPVTDSLSAEENHNVVLLLVEDLLADSAKGANNMQETDCEKKLSLLMSSLVRAAVMWSRKAGSFLFLLPALSFFSISLLLYCAARPSCSDEQPIEPPFVLFCVQQIPELVLHLTSEWLQSWNREGITRESQVPCQVLFSPSSKRTCLFTHGISYEYTVLRQAWFALMSLFQGRTRRLPAGPSRRSLQACGPRTFWQSTIK